jgi:hypothetical protein
MKIYIPASVNSISVVYRVFHSIVNGMSSNSTNHYGLVIIDCNIEYSVYVDCIRRLRRV